MSQTEISIELAGLRYRETITTMPAPKPALGKIVREPVDSQRQKVYDAEACFKSDQPLATKTDVINFVTKLVEKAPIQRRYGKWLTFEEPEKWKGLISFSVVFNDRLRTFAHGSRKGIELHGAPNFSWTKFVICHEIAHVIICRSRDWRTTQAHGREFCGVLLDLVRFGMDRQSYETLKLSFRDKRVKFTKKRNVVFSEEQKAEMRERIKIARASLPARETKPENMIFCSRCSQKIAKHKFNAHWDENHKARLVIDFDED